MRIQCNTHGLNPSFLSIPQRSINPKIKQSVIHTATEDCIEILNNPTTDHHTAIHYWIWKIYQKHGYNLHNSGGHMMDDFAQKQADELLNNYLLNEILKLIPYSNIADQLRKKAINSSKPLSAHFKGKNVEFHKLKK